MARRRCPGRSAAQRNADELKALIKDGDWNPFHVIARGNTIMNIVNGHVTAFSSTTMRRDAR